MSDKMYVFQVLVEPEASRNHVQISTEIVSKVCHVATGEAGLGVNISLIDNGSFPNSLVSKTRKALEISICTQQDLSRDWLVEQVGTDGESYKLVASKDPSLVFVEI